MYVIIYIVYKYKCNYIIYNIVNQFHGGSKGTGLTKSSSYQSRFHEIETSHITSTQIAWQSNLLLKHCSVFSPRNNDVFLMFLKLPWHPLHYPQCMPHSVFPGAFLTPHLLSNAMDQHNDMPNLLPWHECVCRIDKVVKKPLSCWHSCRETVVKFW